MTSIAMDVIWWRRALFVAKKPRPLSFKYTNKQCAKCGKHLVVNCFGACHIGVLETVKNKLLATLRVTKFCKLLLLQIIIRNECLAINFDSDIKISDVSL